MSASDLRQVEDMTPIDLVTAFHERVTGLGFRSTDRIKHLTCNGAPRTLTYVPDKTKKQELPVSMIFVNCTNPTAYTDNCRKGIMTLSNRVLFLNEQGLSPYQEYVAIFLKSPDTARLAQCIDYGQRNLDRY